MRLIYPYYENPQMLERQVENWNRYAGILRDSVKLFLVDDGSQKHPAEPILRECRLPKKLFVIEEDIPWNQHGARNLGAHVACKPEENYWLYMSDMDVILTAEMAYSLFERPLDPKYHYTFERKFLPDLVRSKVHCNTFLVKHSIYWAAGGYDEDYCGTYGGDGPFLRAINNLAPNRHLSDVVLFGVERDVIPDANTDLPRKEGEFGKAYRKKFDAKRKSGDERPKNPLRFKWHQVRFGDD